MTRTIVIVVIVAGVSYLFRRVIRVPVAAYHCDDIEVEEASKSVIEDKSNED